MERKMVEENKEEKMGQVARAYGAASKKPLEVS